MASPFKLVAGLGVDYQDLPKILVKDLNLMRMFNGTYVTGDDFGFTFTEVITIFYDGEHWTLKSSDWFHDWDDEEGGYKEETVCFCDQCFETGSEPINITVRQGETVVSESCFEGLFGIAEEMIYWKLKIEVPDGISEILSLENR